MAVSAQMGFYAGNDFQRVKGLGDIVVCAQHQTLDFIHVLYPGSQHDNGEKIILADVFAELEAIHIGQHHVQKRQINLAMSHTFCGILPLVKLVYLIAFICQVEFQQISHFLFIINYQNSIGHFASLLPPLRNGNFWGNISGCAAGKADAALASQLILHTNVPVMGIGF